MAKPTKFTRYTKGRYTEVVIPKAAAYTVQATYAAFIANAAVGEIGVFNSNTLALISGALGAGVSFFIAQKRTGGTYKTTIFKNGVSTYLRTAYVAPVRCTGSLGWNGTAGSMNLATAPSVGKIYEFGIFETTEGNDPFPAWNFNYTAKPNDAEIDVVGQLAKLVNDFTNPIYKPNAPIVTAKVKAAGTYGNFTTAGTVTVTNGSNIAALTNTIDVVVGDEISFEPAATPTSAIGDVYTVVAYTPSVSITLNRAYTGATQTFTSGEASGTRVKKVTVITATGLVFTDLTDNEHFRITAREELKYADIVNLATYTRGNGTYLQAQEWEAEGLLMQGNTARNTQFGDAAFGAPDQFVVSTTETYDIFTFSTTSPAGLNDYMQDGYIPKVITLLAPKSTGGLSASLNTIFGT